MTDIFDIDPLQNYMGLYVGPNGCGKSIAIASWMSEGSIYFMDFDGRMNSVANWYKQRGLQPGQLLADRYGPGNLYDALKKLDDFIDYCPHAAIVIDSFTALTVSAVTFSLRQRMGSSGKNAPRMSKGNMIIPDWDEWNGEATVVTQMLDLSKQIADKGVAVFWTAHPVQRLKLQGQGSNVNSVTVQTKYAAFGMKSDSLVPIYFNEIYHFGVEYDLDSPEPKRICTTQPFGDIAAKTALNLPVRFDWTNKNFRQEFVRLVEEYKWKGEVNEVGS